MNQSPPSNIDDKPDLSPKHQAFVDAYFFACRKNPTQAYKLVYTGASEKSSITKGGELLKKVGKSGYFLEKREEYEKCLGVTLHNQIETLKEILEINPTEILNIDDISLEQIKALPSSVQKLIESIKVTKASIEVKFVSKQFAIGELNKMLGYYQPEKHDHKIINQALPTWLSDGQS